MNTIKLNSIKKYSLKERASNINLSFSVAIDGTAGSGKGTIATEIARAYNLVYFNSSILYRKLAAIILSNNLRIEDEESIINFINTTDLLNHKVNIDIYTEEVANVASKVGASPNIRKALILPQQQVFADNPRIVSDGRDIGTIIAPNADLKLFIDADLKVRAQRRHAQLKQNLSLTEVEEILKLRDARDKARVFAPLKAAEDAYTIDTSTISIKEVLEIIEKIITSNNTSLIK